MRYSVIFASVVVIFVMAGCDKPEAKAQPSPAAATRGPSATAVPSMAAKWEYGVLTFGQGTYYWNSAGKTVQGSSPGDFASKFTGQSSSGPHIGEGAQVVLDPIGADGWEMYFEATRPDASRVTYFKRPAK